MPDLVWSGIFLGSRLLDAIHQSYTVFLILYVQ